MQLGSWRIFSDAPPTPRHAPVTLSVRSGLRLRDCTPNSNMPAETPWDVASGLGSRQFPDKLSSGYPRHLRASSVVTWLSVSASVIAWNAARMSSNDGLGAWASRFRKRKRVFSTVSVERAKEECRESSIEARDRATSWDVRRAALPPRRSEELSQVHGSGARAGCCRF